MSEETSFVVISVYVLALLMSISIGANDAANSLATAYGSKSLKLAPLCICGAIFEFIGASWGSKKVASNLAYDIIGDLEEESPAFQSLVMLAVTVAAFSFIMASSVFGIPISGTHTIISALVGAGLVCSSSSDIGWPSVLRIATSWMMSPFLASITCLALFSACCALTMDSAKLSVTSQLRNTALIAGFSFTLVSVMAILLF